jgi:hypothetical protein
VIQADDDRASPDPPRLQLDYFAPHEPQRARGRGVTFWSIILLASWCPYLCGVVNASTVGQSYVPHITSAHWNAALLFMGVGMLMAIGCLVRFVSLRHVVGSIASAVVLTVQLTLASCLGLAQ